VEGAVAGVATWADAGERSKQRNVRREKVLHALLRSTVQQTRTEITSSYLTGGGTHLSCTSQVRQDEKIVLHL
jgi:hypothetical protein